VSSDPSLVYLVHRRTPSDFVATVRLVASESDKPASINAILAPLEGTLDVALDDGVFTLEGEFDVMCELASRLAIAALRGLGPAEEMCRPSSTGSRVGSLLRVRAGGLPATRVRRSEDEMLELELSVREGMDLALSILRVAALDP